MSTDTITVMPARSGGRWLVTLARAESQKAALEVYDRLRDAGYAAEIFPVKAGAGHDYLVRITRLASNGKRAGTSDSMA